VYVLLLTLFLLQPVKQTNPLKIIVNAGIDLHQKVLAPAQGDVCNFTPSCSRFGRQAINKYGIIWGSLMAADRLMRCNPWAIEHLNTYYQGIRNGKIFDPVNNNYIFKKLRLRDSTLERLTGVKE
jgi:putative component of membrane protein insertase Oxa1/YidC/SpoIIIJ protein YidD